MKCDFSAPIEIRARFIGRDGSCGFKKGMAYDLWMFQDNGKFIISLRNWKAMAIPYDTMNAIKKNWEAISW